MACTQDSPGKNTQCAGVPFNSGIPPTSTQKGTAKNTHSQEHNVDGIAVVKSEQAAPTKKAKTTVSRGKRQREVDDTATVKFEQVDPVKKARTTLTNPMKDPKTPQTQSPAWQSNWACTQTAATAAIQKSKRQTTDEVAADKARADAEKKRKKELTEENHCVMAQMDVNEGIERAGTATWTIRTFGDLEHDSKTDGEEFEGFIDVSQGEDSNPNSDDQTIGAINLKVRYFSQFKAREVLTHWTEDKQSTSEKDQGPSSKSRWW